MVQPSHNRALLTALTVLALLGPGCLEASGTLDDDSKTNTPPPAPLKTIELYNFMGEVTGQTLPDPQAEGGVDKEAPPSKVEKFRLAETNRTLRIEVDITGGQTQAGNGKVEILNPRGGLIYRSGTPIQASTFSFTTGQGVDAPRGIAPTGEYTVQYWVAGSLTFNVDIRGRPYIENDEADDE